MLLLILLCVLPIDPVARERCDLIETNLFFDDQARLVFEQALFYDWCDQSERFQMRAWRMVKHPSQLPRLNHATGNYECRWMDGDTERVVVAPVVRTTRTQYDPELTERDHLAKEDRRELRNPKTLRKGK